MKPKMIERTLRVRTAVKAGGVNVKNHNPTTKRASFRGTTPRSPVHL